MATLEDPVRVARPADDRRLRRRVQGLPRGARARDPRRQPARRDLPGRAGAGRRRHRGGADGARVARHPGSQFSELLAGATKVAVVIDNQFRPTPSVAAAAGRLRRDRGRGQAGRRRVREREGVPDVGVRHRAEDRPREPRPHGAHGDPVPPERPAQRRRLHLHRGLLARNAGLDALTAVARVRPEDHDRPRAGEPLGRGRRRQADPARRRLRRDDRVEPLRVRPLAADALRRLRRADALRHRRGRDDGGPRSAR